MIKRTLFGLILTILIPAITKSQTSRPLSSDEVLAAAQQRLQKGEACFSNGDYECARREFDSAIDYIFDFGVDVRTDERLKLGLRSMIEKISGYETQTRLAAAPLWKAQEFDGRPPIELVESTEAIADHGSGPLTVDAFQRKFAELRRKFNQKYGRDITLTGADHGEHRRLYGSGSAYDIRVRDLNREQVGFIIANGAKLGLRIKDFSTWDRVAAHNARTIALRRPLDTLATGIHLHIDRMTAPKSTAVAARPAARARLRRDQQSKNN